MADAALRPVRDHGSMEVVFWTSVDVQVLVGVVAIARSIGPGADDRHVEPVSYDA